MVGGYVHLTMPIDINYDIVGNTVQQRSTEFDNEKTVNWYVSYDPTGVTPKSLVPTPGTLLCATLDTSNNSIRQVFSYKELILVFSGTTVYRVDSNYDVVRVGTLKSSSGYISVANDNDQVLVVDGSYGYVYDITLGTFTQITSPDFPSSPIYCVYFNGFFLVCFADSNRWSVSGLNDATNWDPFSFALLSTNADTFKGMGVVNNRLILFGNYVSTTWYSQPNYIGNVSIQQSFPYTNDPNMLFMYGCAATGSIAQGQGKLFWLSSDSNGVGSIMLSDGTTPIPVSPPWVDLQIKNYVKTDDAIGFVYKEDGYIFYQLTFPTQNVTWLYKYNPQIQQLGPLITDWVYLETLEGDCHIASCHTFYLKNNVHIIGSNSEPKIYFMSTNYTTNDGETIHRYRIGPNLTRNGYRRFRIDKLELDFEAGVGNENNPGKAPIVFLKVSYDQAHTFHPIASEEIGRMGQYNFRSTFFQLGVTYDFCARIDVYEPVRVFLTGCNLRLTDGLV